MNVWFYSRIGAETLHAAFWIILIVATLFFPTTDLLLPVLLLLAVPIGWIVMGACPLSLLENYLYPIGSASSDTSFTRSRIGAKIRTYLQINTRKWDCMLFMLISLLALILAVRLCIFFCKC